MTDKMATSPNSEQNPGHGSNQNSTVDVTGDDKDNTAECGIGRFKPSVLRRCANMPVFTGAVSINALLTSTLSTYVNSQVTTLERHFGFSSAQTGLIMAANDAGVIAVILFVSFIATRVHIPRTLGFFSVLFGLSGFVCALPHFLFGAPSPVSPSSSARTGHAHTTVTSDYHPGIFGYHLCDGANSTALNCHVLLNSSSEVEPEGAARAHTDAALAIITVGMILQGVAKSCRPSFILCYVDANVDKVKTGFYIGIILSVATIGPALAFGLGGVFDRIYVSLEDTGMHYRHPRWIGAWWLGYVTFGCLACVFSIPLFFFPRRINGQIEKPAGLPRTESDVSVLRTALQCAKALLQTLIRLWTNPVYMCTLLSSSFLMFAASGVQSFTAKYLENQFAFPSWKANMAMAGGLLGTACLGSFVGGYLTKRLEMGPARSMKFILVVMTVCAITNGLLLLFKCKQPYLYNSPGPRASEETTVLGCLENCACDADDYFPVCAEDGRTFFSPCHAGCQGTAGETYVNCTCLEEGTAVAGICHYGCVMFYPFIATFCVTTLLACLAIIPKLIVYIRAVEERDKALAVGFSSFVTSISGWMLAPICFGKLIDSNCIQWESTHCGAGEHGACLLYDNDSFRWTFLGFETIFTAIAQLFFFLAYIVARVTKKFEKKNECGEDVTGMILIGEQRGCIMDPKDEI